MFNHLHSFGESNTTNQVNPDGYGIIKVAIADDHKIFRKAVIFSLRGCPDIKFVKEADNGQDLIDSIAANVPHVILMDLKMPVKDGIETTKYINKHFPYIKILILTMYEDERFVTHLLDYGANGYLLKSTDHAEIKKAIYKVVRTGFYLNTFVNKILIIKNYSKQKFSPTLNDSDMLMQHQGMRPSLYVKEYIAEEIEEKLQTLINNVKKIINNLVEFFRKK